MIASKIKDLANTKRNPQNSSSNLNEDTNKGLKRTKEKKPYVLRKTKELIPYRRIEENAIHMEDGYYLDIMQIQTRDIYAMNETDLNILMLSETKMLRSYTETYKELALNFPANMEKQRQYWLKKKEETTNPLFLTYINRKLFEFDFIESERTNKEFFIFIYGKSLEELEKNKSLMVRARQNSFPLLPLSSEKKEDVLFMLNNQNTKLSIRGEQ